MTNPSEAFEGTICDECENKIPVKNDVFFHEGTKLCIDCAERCDLVCDCGQYKREEFKYCYDCSVT